MPWDHLVSCQLLVASCQSKPTSVEPSPVGRVTDAFTGNWQLTPGTFSAAPPPHRAAGPHFRVLDVLAVQAAVDPDLDPDRAVRRERGGEPIVDVRLERGQRDRPD